MKISANKMMLTLLFFSLLLVLVLAFAQDFAIAQPGLPGDPDQTPVDGGLGILAALGGAYAIKKLRDRE